MTMTRPRRPRQPSSSAASAIVSREARQGPMAKRPSPPPRLVLRARRPARLPAPWTRRRRLSARSTSVLPALVSCAQANLLTTKALTPAPSTQPSRSTTSRRRPDGLSPTAPTWPRFSRPPEHPSPTKETSTRQEKSRRLAPSRSCTSSLRVTPRLPWATHSRSSPVS